MTNEKAKVPKPGHIFIWDLDPDGGGDPQRLEKKGVDGLEMVNRWPERFTRNDPEEGKGETAPEAATGEQVTPGLIKGKGPAYIPGMQKGNANVTKSGEAPPSQKLGEQAKKGGKGK